MLAEVPSIVGSASKIQEVNVRAFEVPTETPETDGTLSWDSTTLVLVELKAGGASGMGFTYADLSTAQFIDLHFRELILGADPFDIAKCHRALVKKLRNMGRPGVAAMALSAADIALWDLKARLLNVPLAQLFGCARDAVPFYGSGGFTNYTVQQLQHQLGQWAKEGMKFVKMKVGADPGKDIQRVRAASEAIEGIELFVDANGAYDRKQALELAEEYRRIGVRWFEEPVSSDDLSGLRLLRDRAPSGLTIAAGEYGYDLVYFRRMLDAGAVDVLQIDVTRCGGYSVFMEAAAVAQAFGVPISSHCAPTLHTPLGLALPQLQHLEYFFDHARIEQMLFDGAIRADHGWARPDFSRSGLGLRLREKVATPYAVYSRV